MRVTDYIGIQIWNGGAWIDYTEGLLDLQLVNGIQEYKGPFSQPDAGEVTLTSRNPNLDPYNNSDIKYNTPFRINIEGVRMWTGTIEGIDVDYRPKGEDTIVTIRAVDIIAGLYKHVLSDSFVALHNKFTMDKLLTHLKSEQEYKGFDYTSDTDGVYYADAPIENGTTAWDALTLHAKTDLGTLFPTRTNTLAYTRYTKDDPLNWYNYFPIRFSFNSDGTGTSYKNVFLSDGFERIINQLDITGVSTTTTNVTSTIGDSVNLWGKAAAQVTLATDSTVDLQTIANEVLVEMAEPQRDIYEITFSAKDLVDLQPYGPRTILFALPGKGVIEINHEVNANLSINRKYQVIGMRQDINANDWFVTFVLRNWDYQSNAVANPIINISPQTGDQTTDFTFSYTYPNPQEITSIDWDFDDGFTSTDPSATVNYVNAGTKTIILTLGTIYGYDKVVSVELLVSGVAPSSSFTYTADANNVYQFTFTGDGATSYLWNFGDGTQSTQKNPKKYYFSTQSRSVSVTATNAYGSTVSTQTIATTKVTKIPVRYVKYRFLGGYNSVDRYITTNTSLYDTQWQQQDRSIYDYFTEFNIVSTSAGNIKNVDIIDYKEYQGFFTNDPLIKDDYKRTKRATETEVRAKLFDYLADGSVLNNRVYLMLHNAKRNNLDRAEPVLEFTIDLKDYFIDITNFSIYRKANFASAGSTVEIDVSYDNLDFYYIGNFDFNSSSASRSIVPVPGKTLPADWNFLAPTGLPTYTPVQYIKVVSEVASSSNNYYLNSLTVLTGNGNVNKSDYTVTGYSYPQYTPVDAGLGWGGYDFERNTGSTTQLNSGGPIRQLKSVSTPNGYVWQDTSVAVGSTLIDINNRNTTHFYWNAGNAKTFIINLGEQHRNITGLYFDFYNKDNQVMTSNRGFTIYTSSDAQTWTSIGTYMCNSTPGMIVRTVPTTTGSGTSFREYSYPINSGTTWEKLSVDGRVTWNDAAALPIDPVK